MTRDLPDPAATERLGAALAAALVASGGTPRGGAQLHLSGPLGAGKTCCVRGLLRALGVTGPVRSPSYTLVECYPTDALTVYHFDLYRLAAAEELELIGARDYFRSGVLCCVEWPERGAGMLPPATLRIRLSHRRGGRHARLDARSDWGQAWLAAAQARLDS